MASDLTTVPAYRHTMQRLEDAKRMNPEGNDYWLAREIHHILGYPVWDKFLPVIEKAHAAFVGNGVDPSQHIAQTGKMLKVGSGATRRGVDFFLSRFACYLIAMNGDASKPEIAGAQAYFALQTRSAELAEQERTDRRRLANRERLASGLKKIADVAKDVGVQRYDLFHAARHHGLYDTSSMAELHRKKGLAPGEKLIDRAGSLELSAHAFQSEVAREKILNEGINGEANAIRANLEVAQNVRALVIQQSGVKLEDLPLEPEPIEVVQKRIKALDKPRPKKISGPTA